MGSMKLVDIRPQHLNTFYQSLQQKGVRYTSHKVHTKIDLGALLQAKQMSRTALAEAAGISHTTVTATCRGGAHFAGKGRPDFGGLERKLRESI